MIMFILDTLSVYLRHVRASLREPVWMFFNLIQPLIWLLLFTQLFEDIALMPGFPAETYLQYFTPGLVVMLAIFSSAYAGFDILSDIYYGVLEKTLVTPVSRYALILGSAINWVTQLAAQILIVLGIALALGAKVATGMGGVLLTIIVVSTFSLGLYGFSNALVLATKRETPLVVVANLITMPLIFLSSIMMPSQHVPKWMQTAMKLNPANYAVEAVRPLLLAGYNWPQILTSLAVLTVFATIGIIAATIALKRFGR